MRRFLHDSETGLIVPRERRIEPASPRLCSMLHQFQQGQFGRTQSGRLTVSEAVSIYNDLLLWIDFEQNNSDTFWDDLHSSGNDMTLMNSLATSSSGGTASPLNGRWGGAFNAGAGSGIRGQYIPRSNTTFDKGDVNFSFWIWTYITSLPAANGYTVIGGRYGGTSATQKCYAIMERRVTGGTQTFEFMVRNSADSADTILTSGSATSNAWTLLTFVHDATNDQLRSYVNTTKYSQSYSSGVYSGGSSNFSTGNGFISDTTIYNPALGLGHREDQVGFVNHAMTDSEVSYIYNSGAGKTYAAFSADAGH